MSFALAITGPTASGKTALSLALAERLGCEIISIDSMQIYKGMDIGTAKPPKSEIEEFVMGGVDIVTPAEEFSSGAWLRAAFEWVQSVPEDVPIIIVGGTGLYFSALLRGLDRKWEKPPPAYPVIKIDRAIVRSRIASRLDAMFMEGLEEEKKRLCDIASSHLARRTFIGNLYKETPDPNIIGKLSGHKEGSRAFARYRDIDDDMLTDLVSKLN